MSEYLALFLGGAVGHYAWRTVQPWLLRVLRGRRRFLIVLEHGREARGVTGAASAQQTPRVVLELARVLAEQATQDPDLPLPVQLTVEVPR